MSGKQEFGVYVHWPFCAAKCPYCDFNSHVPNGPIQEDNFLKAYRAEIAHWAGALGPDMPALSSVFFGGGTPSLMSPQLVSSILQTLESVWGFQDQIEISLEANPQSVDAANFKDLALAGVNRLSIGVQSFDDASLQALGRLHDSAQARQAIEIAQAHFERFSFDLIYARPNQSLQDWEGELTQAFAFGPTHLSLYQLTIEPNTPYKRLYDAGKLKLPEEGLAVDFYKQTQELCLKAGLPVYEVSNHAVPGQEARHNLLYWRYGTFVGIGPGAHGRVKIDGNRYSTLTQAMPFEWLAKVGREGHGVIDQQQLDAFNQATEMLLMGLRLTQGVSLADIEHETGYWIGAHIIEKLATEGLLETSKGSKNVQLLRTSQRGQLLLNYIAGQLSDGLMTQEQ